MDTELAAAWLQIRGSEINRSKPEPGDVVPVPEQDGAVTTEP
jgi:hypothetical protein